MNNSWDKTSPCCGLSQVVCRSGKSGSSVLISFHWSQKLILSPFSSLSSIHSCSCVPPRVLGLNSLQLSLRRSVHCQPKHILWSPLFMWENPPGSRYSISTSLRSASASQPKNQGAACTNEWRLRGKKQEKRKQTGRWHLVHLFVTLNNTRSVFLHPYGTDAHDSLSLPWMKEKTVRGGVDEGLSLTKGWEGWGSEGGRGKPRIKAFGNTWECFKGGGGLEWQRKYKRAIEPKSCQAFWVDLKKSVANNCAKL